MPLFLSFVLANQRQFQARVPVEGPYKSDLVQSINIYRSDLMMLLNFVYRFFLVGIDNFLVYLRILQLPLDPTIFLQCNLSTNTDIIPTQTLFLEDMNNEWIQYGTTLNLPVRDLVVVPNMARLKEKCNKIRITNISLGNLNRILDTKKEGQWKILTYTVFDRCNIPLLVCITIVNQFVHSIRGKSPSFYLTTLISNDY